MIKIEKKKGKIAIVLIIAILMLAFQAALAQNSYATNAETQIILSDTSITVNGEKISESTSQSVYKSTSIESNSDIDSSLANVSNTVINITAAGTYRISGTITNAQIAVNAEDSDEVNIILDNANITCKTAPAIIVYNALDNEKSGEAGVTITLEKGSENTIIGSHIPKEATYISNGETNSYEEKYDGAISSDISLAINGEGTLNVKGDKEGIETKLHLTINGGNIEINSCDDAINASEDSVSVITINDGIIYANIKQEAEEGDGIDSNGYIYINGGTIYAFASATSQDSGLDSDLGIYINGGTVIGTGNMVDEVSDKSKQKFIFVQFTKQITAGTTICITDENDNPIFGFKTDKTYTTLLYSNSSINTDTYKIYTGGTITGDHENSIYTNITSYTGGTQTTDYTQANSSKNMSNSGFNENMEESIEQNNTIVYVGIALIILGAILVVLIIINLNKKKE